ncbi:MAG: hypothetical protein J6B48_09885 [Clostridia bacterium]|nr:hypothetical protein [Clostridia bacterium]MBO5316721.1 hypothetical protein [Clostridia bacterium]
MSGRNEVTKERIVEAIISREDMRSRYYKEIVPIIGKDAAVELERLYDIYDERLYVWMATLWDPKIGGFYFSSSGRDCDAFLPDIESTVQILRFTESSGLISGMGKTYAQAVPGSMRESLLKFAKGLQDPEDGFFYHPQWGKNIITPRRSRDLRWATDMISRFGDKPYYPTPIDKNDDGSSSALLPKYLQDINEWKNYLASFDMKTKSYWSANMISSQAIQIGAAGPEFINTLFQWLADCQRSDNGLWEPQVNYASVNGLMKLSLLYSNLGVCMPNADKAIKSAITVALSNEPIVFCCQFYNPFATMSNVLENMRLHGDEFEAHKLQKIILERAADLIRVTREKVLTCKRADGSFSYNPEPRSRLSQKAPVGLGLDEGDVNASAICSTGVTSNLCKVLGIRRIPIFCDKDAKIFFDIIDNAIQTQKIYVKPDWFDDAINPNKIREMQ